MQLFDDKFLEDMADKGVEVADIFDLLGDALEAYRKRKKRRMVMRNYPSAFDRLAERSK